MMNRILRGTILSSLLLTILLASCSQQEEISAVEESGEQIVASIEMEEHPLDDELRMLIRDRKNADNTPNGVLFDFSSEISSKTSINLYLYFRKGTQIIVPQTPAKLLLTKHEPENKRYKGTFTITLPQELQGVDLRATPVYVAGAIGVKGINQQGQAIVDPSNEIVEGRYIIPMYFEERPLHRQGNGYAIANVSLKVYGSLLQLNVKSDLFAPVTIKGIGLKTAAFSTSGTINLPTATASSAPTWTANGNSTTLQSVKLSETAILKSPTDRKSLFVWIKPNADFQGDGSKTTPELTLDIFDDDKLAMPSPLGKYSVNKAVADRSVFRITGATIKSDLILSEYHRWEDDILWEVYNPTKQNIDLRRYYFIRGSYDDPSLRRAEPLITDALKLYWDNVNSSIDGSGIGHLNRVGHEPNRRYILPPGRTALFVATGQGLHNGPKRASYTFNFFQPDEASEHNVFRPDNTMNGSSAREGKEYYMLAKDGTAEANIVDVFFRFKNATTQAKSGPAKKLVNAKYLRKPDRNFGRRYFPDQMKDSDWVWRSGLLYDWDFGYRFGYYYWDTIENRYIEGNRADGNLVVFHMDSFRGNPNDVHGTPYIVPTYWIKGVAH